MKTFKIAEFNDREVQLNFKTGEDEEFGSEVVESDSETEEEIEVTNRKMAPATRLEKLSFSGKAEDFPCFLEQFEARLYILGLHDMLKANLALDLSTCGDADEIDTRQRMWCELVQCLEKRCVMMLRGYRGNGPLAWNMLVKHFKGTERPRLQKMMTELTSIAKKNEESVNSYLIRAEDLQLELTEAGETISPAMFVSMVLKGLPKEYEQIITVINYGKTKPWTAIRQDLINFEDSRKPEKEERALFAGNSQKRCHNCQKLGHLKAQCRLLKKHADIKCFNCNRMGHYASDCREPKREQNKSTPDYKRPQAKANLTTTYHDPFSFLSMNRKTTCRGNLVVDSGCTAHMLRDKNLFVTLDETAKGHAGCANDSQAPIEGIGTAKLWVTDDQNEEQKITLTDAYYVPSYCRNLLSVGKITEGKAEVLFNQSPHIRAINGTVFPIEKESDLYIVKCRPAKEEAMVSKATLQRWHERMGHNNRRDLINLETKVEGMKIEGTDVRMCEPCETQKAKRAKIDKTVGTRARAPLEIVHVDVLGPLEESINGYKYAIGFVDSFSRYITVYPMVGKDKVLENVKQFVADMGKPGTLVSDNGQEFISNAMREYCRNKEIRLETTTPYTPEDNGKIERVWGTLMGMARCMLASTKCPNNFWHFALNTAAYVKNRCLHSALQKTPFEAFYKTKPDLSNCKVFGCKVYVFVDRGNKKLDSKANPGVFLGYETNSNGYTVGVPDEFERLRIFASRNVTFDETVGYTNDKPKDDDLLSFQHSTYCQESQEMETQENLYSENMLNAAMTDTQEIEPQENLESGTMLNAAMTDAQEIETRENLESDTMLNAATTDESDKRQRRPPYWMNDYESGSALSATVLGNKDTPKSAKEALESTVWKRAMQDEYDSLIKKETWEIQKLPPGRKPVSSKWNFKVKYGPNGEITRHKARFVARGFTQVQGKDFNETFSPTVRMATLRTMIACAAQEQAMVGQMDIKTAYLNAPLEEEVYLQQPEGFEIGDRDCYLRLKKSLYGLKQSGRNWFNMLKDHMIKLGFKQSLNDPCFFSRNKEDFVCAWVDDLVYFSKVKKDFLQSFLKEVEQQFIVGDSGPLSWFLGMKIQCSPGLITISQKQYINDLLQKFGMQNCKPASTPMADNIKLTKEDTGLQEEFDYRGLVGALNYLAGSSRPDIAYVAHHLSSFFANPGLSHWTAAKHVLRYLQGSKDTEIKYAYNPIGMKIHAYCDADWAGNIDCRRSTSGYAIFANKEGAAVSWSSKLQSTVATSTAEAEVNAAMAASQEITWLREILKETGNPQDITTIMIDNQAAIAIAKNPVQGGKTKHFAIKLQYLRQEVAEERVKLQYVPTNENPADLLTKGLGRNKTCKYLNALTGKD